jgi:hypothetical protein
MNFKIKETLSFMRDFGNYFHVIHPVKQSKKNVPVVCVKVSSLANGI